MKVAIVAAYNNCVEMTREFCDTMQKFWPAGIESHLILVNGGCATRIEHPFIAHRIDLAENIGFCNTLNAGLREVPVDSDYVFFTGNDSFPTDSRWLPDLIELLERAGAWMACSANDRPGMHRYTDLYKADRGDYWEVDFFPSIAWLMPFNRFAEIGLLDEQFIRTGMYADNDYCKRIRNAGGRIVVSKNILLRHLLSQEGKIHGTAAEDMKHNHLKYRYKWKCEV